MWVIGNMSHRECESRYDSYKHNQIKEKSYNQRQTFTKENICKQKCIGKVKAIDKVKAKRENCNTTPYLAVKTLTSQGAFAEMSAVGGTTAQARIEVGKQWWNVALRDDQKRRDGGIRSEDGSLVWSGNDYRNIVERRVWKTNRRDVSSGFGDRWGWKWKGWNRWQFLLSTYIVDDGGGRRSLRSMTCLNEEWLKSSDDVGCDKFVEYVVATVLQIRDSFLESKNGSAGCKVVTEAGNGSVISSKKIFHVWNLSVGSNKRGKRLGRIIDWKRIKWTVVESSGRRHSVSSVVEERRSSVEFQRQGILKDSWPEDNLYRWRNCISFRIGRTILENANPTRLGLQRVITKKQCRGSVSSYFTDGDASCIDWEGHRRSKMILPVPTMLRWSDIPPIWRGIDILGLVFDVWE